MAMVLSWFGLLIGLSSISAWPGDQLLVARARSADVGGARHRHFAARALYLTNRPTRLIIWSYQFGLTS